MTTTPPASAPAGAHSPDPSATAKLAGARNPLSPSELRALAARPPGAGSKPVTSFRALLGEGPAQGCERPKQRPGSPIRPDAELDEPTDRPRRPRPLGPRRDADDGAPALEAFRPPSPILAPPPATRSPGGSTDRAEAAALAERVLLGLRVGRVGRDGHVVQLRIRAAGGADLDVRLRHEDGRLGIVLAARDAAGLDEAQRLERALREELSSRGLALDAIEIEGAR